MLHQAGLILLSLAAADPAPRIAPVTDKSYVDVVLKPRAGKVVFVDFWATYCAPCLGELPGLIALDDKLQKLGGDVVFVSVDPAGDDERIRSILQKRSLPLDTLAVGNDDPQHFIDAVDKAWSGEVPYGVLYGRDGKVIARLSGEQKVADIEAKILEALKKR